MSLKKIFLTTTVLASLTGCGDKSESDHNKSAPLPKDLLNSDSKMMAQEKFKNIYEFSGQQVTGITVSHDGRMFVNFPRWRGEVQNSVLEIKADGTQVPYPDAEWNRWAGEPRDKAFTCVQSVVAHGNSLFVLDPSNPEMKGVVGTPALYEFDLSTNTLKNEWKFDSKVAPPLSYLNDLRIDDKRGQVYITESGLGAIVVLDMKSGKARRLLENHPSTKSEPMTLYVNGKALVKPNGLPQKIHADGIGLYDDYVYYHAVTGYHLYRISAAALANEVLSTDVLGSRVENLGKTSATDGMIFDKKGNLYMADLEKNAVIYRTPSGEVKTLMKDKNLSWADTFTITPDEKLLFTDSKLDRASPSRSSEGIVFPIYQMDLNQN